MRAARRASVVLLLVGVLAPAEPASAWVASAHDKIARAAIESLPEGMPAFFRAGASRVGPSAVDPDYFRLHDLPQLRNAESPEHYLDSEFLNGAEWPPSRYAYLVLLARIERDPYAVGMLPYALVEGVQRLAASFAQVRLRPDDDWAQAKTLHHAGILAHYSADLCQPLHTTIHYNGRAGADGSSPRSGIHLLMDSLANEVFGRGGVPLGPVAAVADPWTAIRDEFATSHALVDRVYELENDLSPEKLSAEALVFGRERVAASVRFTAALFVTAWELSDKISLPSWFRGMQPQEPGAPAPQPAGSSPR